MTTELETRISQKLGNPYAICADYAVTTWHLKGSYKLIDNEDRSSGGVSIVRDAKNDSGDFWTDEMFALEAEDLDCLLASDNDPQRVAMLDDWAVRLGVDIT